MFTRQHIVLASGETNTKLSYLDNQNIGKPAILFLHGFGGFSGSFESMLSAMKDDFRYLLLDFNGFGYSEKNPDSDFSLYNQAVLLQEFIRTIDIDNLYIVAHSTGGTAALLAMADEEIGEKIAGLVIMDAIGVTQEIPKFIANLAENSSKNLLHRHRDLNITSYVLLDEQFFNSALISDDQLSCFREALAQKGALDAISTAAQDFEPPNSSDLSRILEDIKTPVLIVWGEKDQIVNLSDAFDLQRELTNSKVKILRDCGHVPHLEMPERTAEIIHDFVKNSTLESAIDIERSVEEIAKKDLESATQSSVSTLKSSIKKINLVSRKHRLHMSELIDKWTPGTTLLFSFIKILQLMKLCGLKSEENGWRAATGVFLRNDYSKFMLGSYRLRYYNDYMKPRNCEQAKTQLLNRLSEFLANQGDYYWAVEPGVMRLKRRKVYFIDIVEADYDSNGQMISLKPFFDPRQNRFSDVNSEQIELLLQRFIQEFNALQFASDRVRTAELKLRLRFWARRSKQFGLPAKLELKSLIDRLLTATFINFEFNSDNSLRERLRTPDIRRRRNPGWGLLNIFCKFTTDLSEVDLWFQFHHVPVDGMPMQEILSKLKLQWGAAGDIVYPALHTKAARPEIIYCGDRIFRARVFVDFSQMMKVRKYLNAKYRHQMQGSATVAGMVMWGMMHHEFFKTRKFLFPVDMAEANATSAERELSITFARPSRYYYEGKPLESFILFQRAFNRQVQATQRGKSESYELLALYSMIHPIFYNLARYLFPESTGEIVGSLGLSILKDAEMFVSPISDLQLKGFMAIGRMNVPTVDGKTAAAVSICSRREYVKYYIMAIEQLSLNYCEYLGIDQDNLN